MKQVELIRGRIFRLLKDLSVYVSCLPEREDEVLHRLAPERRQETFTRIAHIVLIELGHTVEQPPESKNNTTHRAAKRAV